MGVRIIYDTGSQIACMYDSTTGAAFGPVFESWNARQEIEDFCEWLRDNEPDWTIAKTQFARTNPRDPRCYAPSELQRLVDHWRSIQTYVGDDDGA